MNIPEIIKNPVGRPRKVPTTAVQDALAAPLPDGVAEALAEAEKAYESFSTAKSVASRMKETETLPELDRRARAAQTALQRALARQDVARQLGDEGPSEEEINQLREAAEAAKTAKDSVAARDDGFAEEISRRGAIFAEAYAKLEAVLSPWQDAVRRAAEEQILRAKNLLAEAELAVHQSGPSRHPVDVEFNAPRQVDLAKSVEAIVDKAAFLQRYAQSFRIDQQFAEWRRPTREPDPVPQAINGFINGRMDLRAMRESGGAA